MVLPDNNSSQKQIPEQQSKSRESGEQEAVNSHENAAKSSGPQPVSSLSNDDIAAQKIAKNLKIPQTTVSAKIKNLEKKEIIQGYRAEIDFIKLGFMNYFLELYLEDNENLPQIESWANAHKNMVWLQKIIGTCDIEVEVEVKGRVELESLLNELRAKFKNIRRIVFWSQEYKKLTYLPSKSRGSASKLIS